MNLKEFTKKFIPQFLLQRYHKILALVANFYYGFPSEKLIVIGVTGTNGKSTTAHLIAKVLEGAGFKVGATSTVGFKVAEKEWLNAKKMTMLGRFALQKLLREMVSAGCRFAVIETSSQGIEQFRHLGVNYDAAVFTNLTPEHIEAHGGFENYKKAKGKLFAHLTAKPRKIIDGKVVPKVSVVNADDEHAEYFGQFKADEKYGYGLKLKTQNSKLKTTTQNLKLVEATNMELGSLGARFMIHNSRFILHLFGEFNVYNALATVCVGLSQGLSLEAIARGLEKIRGIPGRMEFIDEGQNFHVLIDHAPEPASMRQLYKTIHDLKFQTLLTGRQVPNSKIIHVLGSAGGGRDKKRRPILGQLAAENADYVIITNEDPYDEDPLAIIDEVAMGATAPLTPLRSAQGIILSPEQANAVSASKADVPKKEGVNLFKILDRGEAIAKALSLAEEGDLVVITGKGSEQAICVANNKKIPWDDREKVRELLKQLTIDN